MGSAESGDKCNILLVDDEESILLVGQRLLESVGYSVRVASDGPEALDVYDRNRDDIDIVLLDMTMTPFDGEETFRRLKQINADVQVVITSGHHEQEIKERFSGMGLADVIQKPFLRDTMTEVIEGVMAHTS